MDIYITGNLPTDGSYSGRKIKLRLPALPEEILFSSAVSFAKYNILDKGAVDKPNGEELGDYSWDGMLPGEARKNEPWIRGEWIAPKKIQTYFSIWRKYGVRLKLLITGTPINHYVYLDSYDMKYSGAYGDYEYSISFKDARTIEVPVSQVASEAPATQPATKREEPEKSGTYTVVKGDCLWDIAEKFYGSGSKYTNIFNANKDKIKNPNLIYPGQVLKIP